MSQQHVRPHWMLSVPTLIILESGVVVTDELESVENYSSTRMACMD